MKDSGTKYWIIDKATLEKLQVLKQFVDFVAILDETSQEHKKNANDVKYLIENLDKPEKFKKWSVSILIQDVEKLYGDFEKGGIFKKEWSVYFQPEFLIVDIEEYYVNRVGSTVEKTIFESVINFKADGNKNRIKGDTNYLEFVDDAFFYRDYLTKKLNDVETEIEIWE